MASLQAKIRGETLIIGVNKNYRPIPFQPDAQQRIQKKQEKFKKIPLWLNLKPKQVEKG